MNEPILVVEDDPAINRLICETLAAAGYRPEPAYSGSEASLLLARGGWRLVILDLMLPGKTGEQVLTELRQTSSAPVIVASARVDKATTVELLAAGADDYVTKPFDLGELVARVGAHLRRSQEYVPGPRGERVWLDIVLDPDTREVEVAGRPIRLTAHEFDLLAVLISQPRRVFSRQSLYEQVWGGAFVNDAKTVSVHIGNLRAKLNAASAHRHITTVWGVGFRLAE